MRATDLLGATVYDVEGKPVGAVRDLRFEVQPANGSGAEVRHRLTALECGPIGLAHRLGYDHGDLLAPWPLTPLLRRLTGRSLIVRWSDVTRISDARVEISRKRAELSHPPKRHR
ncbi:PRC-barrel domain-containing protein [Phytohabitans kaempferiae]|uniref:PRC-barrel domain-containing protein n=1 Tax=Phytohabitans kaempferiae TaxID=1620943 RepID=A0ABV6MB59_9ACTN